jgi:hypothetical protein
MNDLNIGDIRIEQKNVTVYQLLKQSFGVRHAIFFNGLVEGNQQSSFIESILIRIPMYPIVIDSRWEDEWRIMIGSQRFCIINSFIQNKFSLQGMEYLKELNSLFYKDIGRQNQRRIEETFIPLILVEKGTSEENFKSLCERFRMIV